MQFINLTIPDVVLIKPVIFNDDRGFFMESYHRDKYYSAGITSNFIQDNYVKSIRNTEILLGSYLKKPSKSELKNKKFVRKSIVAKKNIKKGEKFSEDNLICKRPEGGISPIYWNHVVGKKSKQNFKIDDFIYLK